MNKINQNINSCARVAFIFNFSLLAFSWTSKLIRTKQELEKTADISRPHHWFPAKWRLRNENRDFILMTCHYLPRTETSFSRWKCERKGRREGDNRRPFPSSLAVHHHVARVSRSPLRREKRSAWGGSWFTISIWVVPTIGWSKFPSRMTNQNTDWTSFGGVTSGDVGKCRMLSKATDVINWGGAWWDWVELHYGIVLGDKSVPEQKHMTNFMKRAFLLSTTFFSNILILVMSLD